MDDLVFSVEIIHSCTYFSFLPGSNDRCLSTTILFSNKPPQETISIFGGSNIIRYFIIAVLWCILTKIKGSFLTLFQNPRLFVTILPVLPSCPPLLLNFSPSCPLSSFSNLFLVITAHHLLTHHHVLYLVMLVLPGFLIAINDSSLSDRLTHFNTSLHPTFIYSVQVHR